MGTSTVKLNGTTLMTVADTTATAPDVAQNKYFYTSAGVKTAGAGSGGGDTPAGPGVRFFDYDGTVLHTYTADEFAELSAMPSNPSHTGLTAQGWNWDLPSAKTYVAKYKNLDIGQMYITDDGKTRVYITLPCPGEMRIRLIVNTTGTSEAVRIDWGDQSDPLVFGYTGTNPDAKSHYYDTAGDYVITITPLDENIPVYIAGRNAQSFAGTDSEFSLSLVTKIEFGSGISRYGDTGIHDNRNLSAITFPKDSWVAPLYDCYALQHVTVPSGLYQTSTEPGTCNSCVSLSSVSLPVGLTTIPSNMFYNCKSLDYVTVPDTVTSIGNSAFYSCPNIKIYGIDGISQIKYQAFDGNYGLTNSMISDTINLSGSSGYQFNDCINLKTMTIGADTSTIYTGAFRGCTGLKEVTILSSPSVGQYAFYNCTSLEKINISSGFTSNISNYAFNGCKALTGVKLASGVTSIGNSAFSGCELLTDITIPSTVTSIGSSAFQSCHSLKTITIPSGITNIGNSFLEGAYTLNNITLPSSITQIGNYAFRYCRNLTSITLPTNLTSIGTGAFSGCSRLKSFTNSIPNTVTSIGDSAFSGCHSLQSVNIPTSVTTIGQGAFSGCSSISSPITIPSGVTTIAANTFYRCTMLPSVSIPSSVTSIGGSTFYECSSLASVNIPSGITAINSQTFYSCKSLLSISIPDTVTTIGNSAFYGCTGLTAIVIPTSVTTIEQYAFDNCPSLETITISASVTSIANSTFRSTRHPTVHMLGTTPPTLGTNVFNTSSGYQPVIYVPYSADGSVLASYKSATNWSAWANYMQEEPQ